VDKRGKSGQPGRTDVGPGWLRLGAQQLPIRDGGFDFKRLSRVTNNNIRYDDR